VLGPYPVWRWSYLSYRSCPPRQHLGIQKSLGSGRFRTDVFQIPRLSGSAPTTPQALLSDLSLLRLAMFLGRLFRMFPSQRLWKRLCASWSGVICKRQGNPVSIKSRTELLRGGIWALGGRGCRVVRFSGGCSRPEISILQRCALLRLWAGEIPHSLRHQTWAKLVLDF